MVIMARMGQLGCTGLEARERLKRLMNMGLKSIGTDESIPLKDRDRAFIKDMVDALSGNKDFEPSYGQVVYAQDLFDRYLL